MEFYFPIICCVNDFNAPKNLYVKKIIENSNKVDSSTQTDIIKENPKLNEEDDLKYSLIGKKRFNQNPTGRKKIGDKTIRKHNKYSYDNCIYKIKNRAFNCVCYTLNNILKIKKQKENFQKIEGKILKNGTRDFNIKFLNSKISEILTMNVSKKYSDLNGENNKKLIQQFSTDPLIKEILDFTFYEAIEKLFVIPKNDYEKKYSFSNVYLLDNLKLEDEKEKEIINKLINDNLVNYFEAIKGRKKRI
jgi:hypothetical protein